MTSHGALGLAGSSYKAAQLGKLQESEPCKFHQYPTNVQTQYVVPHWTVRHWVVTDSMPIPDSWFPRSMTCDCDFLGTGGRGLVTTPSRVGGFFANLSEKYAQVKLDHFPQSPEWKLKENETTTQSYNYLGNGWVCPNQIFSGIVHSLSEVGINGLPLKFPWVCKKSEISWCFNKNPKAMGFWTPFLFFKTSGFWKTAEFLITKIPFSTT